MLLSEGAGKLVTKLPCSNLGVTLCALDSEPREDETKWVDLVRFVHVLNVDDKGERKGHEESFQIILGWAPGRRVASY